MKETEWVAYVNSRHRISSANSPRRYRLLSHSKTSEAKASLAGSTITWIYFGALDI
jgi:hypothetical protein